MRKPSILLCALAVSAWTLSSCDNVGRAFDRDIGGGSATDTQIQAAVAGAVSVDGRPKVKNVFPKGNGWPGTVPIVVEFNESVGAASVTPTGGTPTLFVRQAADSGTPTNPGGGTQTPTPLAASYDFLLGGRVVVIRPTTAFDPTQALTFEVVISPELRDADGVRFGGTDEKVLGTFTADQSDEILDGEILTVLPIDNAKDTLRENPIYAIFTKPATQNSVTTGASGNFNVRPQGGANLAGQIAFPIRAGGGSGNDGRIVEFTPTATLGADRPHEIVVANTILFGQGKLEFRGRTPFARFTTTAPGPVTAVAVGNATAGAPDKVNSSNVATLRLDVDLPADSLAGDQVVARIYGRHKDGGTSGSLNYFEVTAVVPGPGAQTVSVDFTGKLGTPAALQLLEGPLTLAARLKRGSRTSGFVLSPSNNNPALDVTPPTLQSPAADTAGNRVYVIDQEVLSFFGRGAENLSAATLVLDSTPAPAPGATTASAFGFGSGGRFMFEPIQLHRRAAPLGFSLTISDAAGNESQPFTGTIVQRGLATGTVSPAGDLVVEAYNDATLEVLAGATVIIEPGLPTAPASTNRRVATTDATGRTTFTGLAGSSYSITIVAAGFDLVTLLDTAAGYVSLPLRPTTSATATVRGTAAFTPSSGQTALIGCNILDDILAEEIRTTTTSPTTIPPTAVRPNRPYVLTAFSGRFEPAVVPTFENAACSICGVTGTARESALPPIEVGGTGQTTLALLPATTAARNIASTYQKDLSTWPGLNAATLPSPPTVRVMTSLFGMPQMTLTGIGFAEQVGATTTYTINATYSLSAALIMAPLLPKFWVSTEATDVDGNTARHRRIILDTTAGTTFMSGAIPGIPTITAPTGPTTDSPAVTFQDRLDASVVASGLAFQTLTATSGGRTWRIFRQDKTAAVGATTIQLPLFGGLSVTGLAKGTWEIRAAGHLFFSLSMANDDFVLEEMRREEVSYARAASKQFTVN